MIRDILIFHAKLLFHTDKRFSNADVVFSFVISGVLHGKASGARGEMGTRVAERGG
jgi:hypothetical protein